jgi:apoptosis-inducing factor 3
LGINADAQGRTAPLWLRSVAATSALAEENRPEEESMSQAATAPTGPDLSRGIALDGLPENGMRLGHIGGEPALLVRHKGGCFAIGATCTHYGGPLAEGIVVDGAVRCPWSLAPASICAPARPHAPPALAPVALSQVERKGSTLFARE